jgi:hypothetical protein
MAKPLPDKVVELIRQHGKAGREAVKAGDLPGAEKEFLAAWAALPEPKLEYDHAQSLARGITAFYRDSHRPNESAHWLAVTREAYGNPAGDPSVDFLGATVAYEAGDTEQAFAAFDALYKRFRSRPFEGAPKHYLEFYKKRATGG